MYDHCSEPARQAVVAAQDAAPALKHDFIGTEHLPLGLAQTAVSASEVLRRHGVELGQARRTTERLPAEAGVAATGGQAAKDARASRGIDVAEIQRRADDTFGPGAFRFPRPAFTTRAKKGLEPAAREAHTRGHRVVDTELLLLGGLAQEEGVAVQVPAA
ncbi:Clp protease N-terminal domain-containing protein [Streptomyces sp. NPDC052107]|uniref:Clp protease N-terminal domain-containing protein n=1 Tax=Streptomyces sp. NPDC052107 TaxID=3155632 RepID=UPI00342634E8